MIPGLRNSLPSYHCYCVISCMLQYHVCMYLYYVILSFLFLTCSRQYFRFHHQQGKRRMKLDDLENLAPSPLGLTLIVQEVLWLCFHLPCRYTIFYVQLSQFPASTLYSVFVFIAASRTSQPFHLNWALPLPVNSFLVFNRLWAGFAPAHMCTGTKLIECEMVILKSCDKTDHNASCEDRYSKAVTRTTSDS